MPARDGRECLPVWRPPHVAAPFTACSGSLEPLAADLGPLSAPLVRALATLGSIDLSLVRAVGSHLDATAILARARRGDVVSHALVTAADGGGALVARVKEATSSWVATDTTRVRTSGRSAGRVDGGLAAFVAGLALAGQATSAPEGVKVPTAG